MRNIIFIAPPAAGKGTISDYLSKHYGYIHLSTGDMLREEVKSGSQLGQEIDALISKGKFASDELVIRLVQERLLSRGNKPFILDGFPRTMNQAQKLSNMLITMGVTNNVAIYLDVDYDTAMKRALGRIVCPKCGRSYNKYVEVVKPQKDNLCDDCLVELEVRSDDNEETFKKRFDTYLENTMPIMDFYKELGILKNVKVDDDVDHVIGSIMSIVDDNFVLERGTK